MKSNQNKFKFKLVFTFGLTFMAASAFGQDYRESSCYKEYAKVYENSVKRAMDSLRARQEIAFRTGIVLDSAPSDEGKSEKSVLNAADLDMPYDESMIGRSMFLNDFHYIHREVLKEYPSTPVEQTRKFIRLGFETNAFCSKFLFFENRYDKKDVAEYVVDRMTEELESRAIADARVNDSEMDKDTEAQSPAEDGGQGAQAAQD